jgi:hypothetical protein
VTNPSSERAAFKLKMSSSIELVATPRMAALEPQETIVLQIWLVKHDAVSTERAPGKLVLFGALVPAAWTVEKHKNETVEDVFDEGKNKHIFRTTQEITWMNTQDVATAKVSLLGFSFIVA